MTIGTGEDIGKEEAWCSSIPQPAQGVFQPHQPDEVSSFCFVSKINTTLSLFCLYLV